MAKGLRAEDEEGLKRRGRRNSMNRGKGPVAGGSIPTTGKVQMLKEQYSGSRLA